MDVAVVFQEGRDSHVEKDNSIKVWGGGSGWITKPVHKTHGCSL
jgi:hypothetical protein